MSHQGGGGGGGTARVLQPAKALVAMREHMREVPKACLIVVFCRGTPLIAISAMLPQSIPPLPLPHCTLVPSSLVSSILLSSGCFVVPSLTPIVASFVRRIFILYFLLPHLPPQNGCKTPPPIRSAVIACLLQCPSHGRHRLLVGCCVNNIV